jgi:hypothetical protein
MLERASPACRHPVDRADCLAIDQDDALVALAHLGQVALGDHRLAAALGEHLEQRAKFSSSGRTRNTPAPPLPNSGFRMMS